MHRYADPSVISTFAAYGSFLLGTGLWEHRLGAILPPTAGVRSLSNIAVIPNGQ